MSIDSGNPRPMAKWVRHGSIRVTDPDVRIRVDRYLCVRFTYRSRTQWARIIEARRVLVNGRAVRPSTVIRTGDRIDYVPQRRPEPPVTIDVPVLLDDEHVLAVNKPAGLPVHPSGRYFRNTLLCALLDRRGETLDQPGIRIVHRLDRETSGVVLFGKTREDTSYLARQFEAHTVEKEYLALVHGVPSQTRFVVDAALGRDLASRVRKAVGVVAADEGRSAVTEFEIVARGPAHALLRARPRTGRLHQIRVHARHAGFPIVGDKLYGLSEEFFLKLASGAEYTDEDRARLLHPRQGLHAHKITLRHPGTLAPFTCEAPLPADLRELCARLGLAVEGVESP